MNERSLLYVVLAYLVVINMVTFFMYGVDKWKARKSKWRISEATLLGLAVMGGSIGAWLGMKVWHHKTLHKKFKYGVPLILVAQVVLVLLCSCASRQKLEISDSVSHEYVPEHSPEVFLVTYDAEIGKEPLMKAVKEYKCEIVYDYKIIHGMALKKPKDMTLEQTMQLFKKVKGVLTVEYDHVYRLTDPVKPKLKIQ